MTDTPGSGTSKTLTTEIHYHEAPFEHFTVRDVGSVEEFVDPRLSLSSRPSAKELEEGIARHLARTFSNEYSHQEEESEKEVVKELEVEGRSSPPPQIFYVDWERGDPRNPANFTRRCKWTITIAACALTGLSAAAASTYALGYPSMTRDLNCTNFQATIGLSMYALGFAITPLVTAPLSEEFGRQPLYRASTFVFLMMHLAIALSHNIQSVLIFRFIQGAAGSTGATMVGGTVADIWAPHERGLPMSTFAISAIGGTGLGPAMAGWIEMDTRLEWRWIQWLHFIVTAVYFVIMLATMKETRSSVLLTRLAQKLRQESGDNRYRARIEDERGSLRTLILISCTRPIHLLLTEPVVASFSLWIGFGWGVLYVLIESISPAFTQLHHFNIGEVGTVFIAMTVGSVLGFTSNLLYQERIYDKRFKVKGQEARLYSACVAGILFPSAMFLYAWTSFEKVHWIGMAIGITLFIWAVFIMYLAVFTYLADCYGPFASSALAGQSLCRNLAAMVFPLFTTQMYERLSFKWATTLFGCIAVLMTPIPFILFFYGPRIRAGSKFASKVPAFGS